MWQPKSEIPETVQPKSRIPEMGQAKQGILEMGQPKPGILEMGWRMILADGANIVAVWKVIRPRSNLHCKLKNSLMQLRIHESKLVPEKPLTQAQ